MKYAVFIESTQFVQRCKKAEQAELKRCQAEARAEEKRRLKDAKFAELLTLDEALSFLWHNVGRGAVLVALSNLGGLNKDRAFQMVISGLHEAMEQQTMSKTMQDAS